MDTTKCTEIIEKVGENNVEVRLVLYSVDDTAVTCETTSYGQNRIDEEKSQHEAIQALHIEHETCTTGSILYNNAQVSLDRLDLIQAEMSKL